MTGPAPAPDTPPARDELTPRVFRALYAGYELRAVEGTMYVAVPKGTAWHAGRSIGEIARQISDREHPGPGTAAPEAPVAVPLPQRPAPAPAAPARAAEASERTA
jgi:hypothetical protein